MNPANHHLDQYVLAADPVALMRMLFQRAIVLVQESRRHLAAGEIVSRSNKILHVYAILTELLTSLKDEEAPELCSSLRSLYLYMQQRLLDANLKQQDAPLQEVLNLLVTLSDAWVTAQPEAHPTEARTAQTMSQPEEFPFAPVVNTRLRSVLEAYAA